MVAVAVKLCLLLPTAADGVDEDISNEACLACHGIEGFSGSDDRPLFVDAAVFAGSAHAPFDCTTCHADVAAVPHAEELAPVGIETCAACHGDAVDEYRKSVHTRLDEQGHPAGATCRDCHGEIHAVTPHTEKSSPAHWSRLAATCAHCHANVELTEKFRIPVVRPVEAYEKSVHARAVAAGVHGAVCSDCHRSHAILRGSDPQSSISRTHIAETCGTCHGEVLHAFQRSVHGEAAARGVRDAPVCTDCHGEHRVLASTERDSPVFAANIPRATCGRCHGNARLSEKYGLPVEKFSAFQDSFHGLALRAGQLTVANCASCHGVHDIHPSGDPRSTVNPANLPETCGKCHPGAGTRFALGPVHMLPKTSKTEAAFWIRLVYLWLIGIVVGFMVVHNGLDFVHKARWPFPRPESVPLGQRERMSRLLRWQHGLVMVSFPVLVYSGFALTYPESWWAMPLLRWETSLGLRGLLHRVAAVVLLVGLLGHVAHLLISRDLRARLRGLWWSTADWRHLRDRLAWSIGRRRVPPHTGACSYIEKTEYWAFLWGMVIMTATGLLLWFADVTLRYLPKWTTDVATAIHFYEAILATLAILVWHLYWVIFDPDVYPMDWSWWTGRAPASREIERRPNGAPESLVASASGKDKEGKGEE